MTVDLQPNLKGELLELRPLRPEDWDDLFAVASDSLIWEQHPESDRYKENVFKIFFKDALESAGAFVVIDRENRRVIGSTRFYGYDPEKSEIEIGWTFLARKYWGGRFNAEMKQLLLNHAFKFVESVVFFVGEDNVRSQRAMEKVGAIKIGTATRAYGNHPPVRNVKYIKCPEKDCDRPKISKIPEFPVDSHRESVYFTYPAKRRDRFHQRSRCSSLARQANSLQSMIV